MKDRRKSKELPPIYYKPDDPENKFLSKEDYVKKNEAIKARRGKADTYVKGLEAEDRSKDIKEIEANIEELIAKKGRAKKEESIAKIELEIKKEKAKLKKLLK